MLAKNADSRRNFIKWGLYLYFNVSALLRVASQPGCRWPCRLPSTSVYRRRCFVFRVLNRHLSYCQAHGPHQESRRLDLVNCRAISDVLRLKGAPRSSVLSFRAPLEGSAPQERDESRDGSIVILVIRV